MEGNKEALAESEQKYKELVAQVQMIQQQQQQLEAQRQELIVEGLKYEGEIRILKQLDGGNNGRKN